jgi:hypothetical protein
MTGRTRLASAIFLCAAVACFLGTAPARAGTPPPISTFGDLLKVTIQYVSSLWSNAEESGNCVDPSLGLWSNAEESGNCVDPTRDSWSNAEESGNCVPASSDAVSNAEELGS